jgi:hypothetical protein
MAKLTKKQLKSIVKECLVEILVEGLDGGSTSPSIDSRAKKNKAPNTIVSKASRQAHTVQDEPARRPSTDHVRFESAIQESVGSLTSNPMMADIFNDTARTTLQEQLANEPPGGASSDLSGPGPQEQIGDPSELFAASENWAALAFSDTPSKKS